MATVQVHIWNACLDQSTTSLQRLLDTLSSDEKLRASRFHFERDRQHYIAARGILRSILSKYLSIEPEQFHFHYTEYGKPYLKSESSTFDLRFNLSHSHGMALFAFTEGCEVGVDIEWIRKGITDEQIAERFFSIQEVKALRQLPEQDQDEAFFNCWTRKEAFIKAKGEGLSMPLDDFVVSLMPGEPASLLSVKNDPQEPFRWTLQELPCAPGFAAAFAIEAKITKLELLEWPNALSQNLKLEKNRGEDNTKN
jgi:4'-phosphopantetheinyl transferase